VKRGIGLLESWLRLSAGAELDDVDTRATETDLDKAFLVSGDVWLHRNARYDHRLLKRMEHIASLQTFSGPSPLLRSEYHAAARRRLLPPPGVHRETGALVERWRDAATEWMGASDLVEEWSRIVTAPGALRALRHPARTARHVVALARQAIRGLPTPARQQSALPLLIQLALSDGELSWLHSFTARLLGVPRLAAVDLPGLMRRLLLAWYHGTPSRTRLVEPPPAARWTESLAVPIRRTA
jgi:hypothetical protein